MAKRYVLPEEHAHYLTLDEACKALGFSEKSKPHVRRLVAKEKKLSGVKYDMGAHEQWFIDPDSIAHYLATKRASPTASGMRRWAFRFREAIIDIDGVTTAVQNELERQGVATKNDQGEPNWTFGPSYTKKSGGKSKKAEAGAQPEEVVVANVVASIIAGMDEDL